MPTVTRSRTVPRRRQEVWELVSDPWQLPRWWPHVERVEEATPETWTTVMLSSRGRAIRADHTRTASEEPERLEWRQELDESPFERVFASASTVVELGAEDDASTRVELTAEERLRGRYRLGGWLVRRAARRRLDDALAAIAAATE